MHFNFANKTLDGFENCEATIDFLRKIDHLFDILNSRNPIAKNYKAPMRPTNRHLWEPFLNEMRHYIVSMKNASGTPMTMTNRKTQFLGFIMAIDSTIAIFNDFVAQIDIATITAQEPMKYLLTYKLSQDHIEHFWMRTLPRWL